MSPIGRSVSICFVTTCGPDYDRPWIFPTMGMLSCRNIALLDPTDDRPLCHNTERVDYVGDRFYQHGKFLDGIEGLTEDDVVILADADAVLQRDLDGQELDLLYTLGDSVAVGFNVNRKQVGCEELSMLKVLDTTLESPSKAFRVTKDHLRDCRMYNWGLVAAKVSTWKRIRKLYERMVEGVNPQQYFRYVSWMQYLLCVLLYKYKIPVVELEYKTHSHCHFGLMKEHGIKYQVLWYNYERVFFAHYVPTVCYK